MRSCIEPVVLDFNGQGICGAFILCSHAKWVRRAEQIEEKCKLSFNLELAVLVIILNLLKVDVIAYALFAIKQKPLVTIGDAVASFLQTPDSATTQMCLRTKADFQSNQTAWSQDPVEYKRASRSFRMAVSKSGQMWFSIW
jgi:hypothetical protein